MPDRLIRQSCRSSATLQALSPEAERLWWRLTTVADDHGLFDANPAMLASTCFPLWRALPTEEVEEWLEELAAVGGVALYEHSGRRYGVFVHWKDHQTTRGSKPKHPLPDDDIVQQAIARNDECKQKSPYSYSYTKSYSDAYGERQGKGKSAPNVAYTSKGFEITEGLLSRWIETYPGVDVPAQIRAAFAWAEASPDRRKSNWTRFLVNWLKREFDKLPKPAKPLEKVRPAILDEPGVSLTPMPVGFLDGLEKVGKPVKW